jgi:hypothetical protein
MSQQGWIQIMKPVSSILKFRLPWDLPGGLTKYLDGTIYFPVYGKVLTHEARLVVRRGAKVINYNNRLYEGQMAYYNQVLRPAMYSYGGQTKCFDCTSFRHIVCDYLVKTGLPDPSETGDYSLVDQKCSEIETELNYFRHQWDTMRMRSGISSNLRNGEEEDEEVRA